MPKQVKAPAFAPGEKKNRILALIAMISAFALGGALSVLIATLDTASSEKGSLPGLFSFITYTLFLALTAAHCIHGVVVFGRHEHYGVLFSSILNGVSAFTALINIQFALSLLFSSIGEEGLASKVIGQRSFDQFMADQRAAWALLIFGIALTMLTGLSAVINLMTKK